MAENEKAVVFGYQNKTPFTGVCCVCGKHIGMGTTVQWNKVLVNGKWKTESIQCLGHRFRRDVAIEPNGFDGLSLCLRDSYSDENQQWADVGCAADLTAKVFAAWDGTKKPFVVTCDCGREYEYVLTICIEAERRDV